MSWDVMINRFDGPPPPVEDIDDDYRFLSLGDASEVRARISAVLAGVDWSDPAWGILDGDGFSIEFNFQEDGPVTGFTLHVRGGGDPITPIVTLCKANGWAALDTSAGSFLDLERPSYAGWQLFQRFRDQLLVGIGREQGPLTWLRRLLGRTW